MPGFLIDIDKKSPKNKHNLEALFTAYNCQLTTGMISSKPGEETGRETNYCIADALLCPILSNP